MEAQLKKAIIECIFDNQNEFQLTNFIIEKFRPYIYDSRGYYLIGGEYVVKFIENAIKLITN